MKKNILVQTKDQKTTKLKLNTTILKKSEIPIKKEYLKSILDELKIINIF
jgi:hypothetical protein